MPLENYISNEDLKKEIKFVPLTEASLEQTTIYNVSNKSFNITQTLVSFIKGAKKLTSDNIFDAYAVLKKGVVTPLSKAILQAFDSGKIEMLYNESVKVPSIFPFIIRKGTDGKPMATVFASSVGKLNKDDVYSCSPTQVVSLLESALIGVGIQKPDSPIHRDFALMKVCASAYTNIMLKQINRIYSISIDSSVYQSVKSEIALFFIKHVWGSLNDDVAKSVAFTGCPDLNQYTRNEIIDRHYTADVGTIDKFLSYLSQSYGGLNGLNFKLFLEKFVIAYGAGAALSMEYLPYVFYLITNVMLGSFLLNQNSLKNIITKETDNISFYYKQLGRLSNYFLN